MHITFYAGAADAAGTTTTQLDEADLTGTELLARLAAGDEDLASVLANCSLLVDGASVRDTSERIPGQAKVDVLPPFAGG